MPQLTATCQGCQGALPLPSGTRPPRNPRKWCSEKCRVRTHRYGTGLVSSRDCPWCSRSFRPARIDQVHCSTECWCAARNARQVALRAAARDVQPRDCANCGAVFTPTPNNAGSAVYCRIQCQRRAHKLRYRARLVAATTEEFRLIDVFERDAWTCQICLGPIARELKAPDQWAASVDHRIPLSRGGAHSLDNCQAAHLWCNSVKKDRDFSFAS